MNLYKKNNNNFISSSLYLIVNLALKKFNSTTYFLSPISETILKFLTIILFIFPFTNFAISKEYKLVEKTGLAFHIPYSMGTHDGEARIGKAKIILDMKNPIATSGEFTVPIETMTTGNPERDCHMRESLGLNYEQSDFPKVHVCNEKNQLPETGKNAVVFPEIIFKILSLKSNDPSGEILTDRETQVEVEGQLSIHGVNRKEKIPLKIIPVGDKIRLQGEMQLSLKDYNIVVKSGKILFVTISVKDLVKASFNLLIEPDLVSIEKARDIPGP